MQRIGHRYLEYYERHRTPLNLRRSADAWTYDLGKVNGAVPTHAPVPSATGHGVRLERLLPSTRIELTTLAAKERVRNEKLKKSGVEDESELTIGRQRLEDLLGEQTFELMKKGATGETFQQSEDRKGEEKTERHRIYGPAAKAMETEAKREHSERKLNLSVDREDPRAVAMDSFERLWKANWPSYLTELSQASITQHSDLAKQKEQLALAKLGSNQQSMDETLGALADLAAAEARGEQCDVEREEGEEEKEQAVDTFKKKDVFNYFNSKDCPVARAGFYTTGIKKLSFTSETKKISATGQIIEIPEHERVRPIYSQYMIVVNGDMSMFLDFSETRPIIRDVMPGVRNSSQSPQIERGHRVVQIHGRRVEDLSVERMLELLDIRPVSLVLECRQQTRAALEVAIGSQVKAFTGGSAKLLAQRQPLQLPRGDNFVPAIDFCTMRKEQAEIEAQEKQAALSKGRALKKKVLGKRPAGG